MYKVGYKVRYVGASSKWYKDKGLSPMNNWMGCIGIIKRINDVKQDVCNIEIVFDNDTACEPKGVSRYEIELLYKPRCHFPEWF